MSDEQLAPETKGVTVELLATVDLGPEIEGMAGRHLRMRMVTIEPGGVLWAGRRLARGQTHDALGRRRSTAGSSARCRRSSSARASWTSARVASSPIETHSQSFYASMADRCAEAAVKTGVVSEIDGRAWLQAFRQQAAHGPIVAGRLHIFVWGRKLEETSPGTAASIRGAKASVRGMRTP
jgi:hypothetical protein